MANHHTLIVGGNISDEAQSLAAERGIALASCKPYPSEDELVEAVNAIGADAIIVRMGKVTRAAIERMPTLRIIAKHGVGYDSIDVDGAATNNVVVVIAGGANALSVAEQALALLMSVARSTAWLDRRVRTGHWDKSTYAGVEVSGRSIGLIGLGAIGRTFLELLAPFRMQVRVYDPYLFDDQVPQGAQRIDNVADLLKLSDVVSLHCPLTDTNRNLIDAQALRQMKSNAILINTARGGLIDQDALVAALRDGTILGAGVDTFVQEPPAADSPLWDLQNLVVSPHIGANTHEARARVGTSCIAQIADYLESGAIDARNHVNAAAMAVA